MTRWLPLAAVLVGALAIPRVADAQARLHLLEERYPDPGHPAPRFLTLDPDTRQVVDQQPVTLTWSGGGPYITPDGGLAVWVGTLPDHIGKRLTLFAPSTGALATHPMPIDWKMAGNPTMPEVYLHDDAGAFAMSVAGVRRFPGARCGFLSNVTTSADGSRVYYVCTESFEHGLIVDVASGAVVMTVPTGLWSAALSANGRSLYAVAGPQNAPVLRRYDVDSAAVLSEAPIAGVRTLIVDPRTGQVFLVGTTSVQVVDPVSLQALGTLSVAAGRWVFDPQRPRAYVLHSRMVEPFGYQTTLEIVDTEALAVVSSNPIAGDAWWTGLALATNPVAPIALAAQVSGANVHLSWSPGGPPATVVRYLLEVGSAPGLNDIFAGLDLGLQTSFGASGVPPGRYYVRVRAGNYTGLSAPSNEVVVQVP